MQKHEGSQNPDLDKRKPWLRAAVAAMEDGLVLTDAEGYITFINPAAQAMTGWSLEEVRGALLDTRLQLLNPETGRPLEPDPAKALREGQIVELAQPTVLAGKKGHERLIEGRVVPVRNRDQHLTGLMVLLRDVTQRQRAERAVEEGIHFGDTILATLRDPFLVLDRELRVKSANRAFYETFRLTRADAEQKHLFELHEGQWNIPQLRARLEQVAMEDRAFEDFEVDQIFPVLGRRSLLFSARRFHRVGNHTDLVLLSVEDVTARKWAQAALEDSEHRYRRLFETAKDGILILNVPSGQIIDANPFIRDLLGYTFDELCGKELWEIGLFEDKQANQEAYRELQRTGYIRYDHLPMRSKNGHEVAVEFVSNSYRVEGKAVIQCNIRDITERSRLEQQTQAQAQELADLNRRKDEFLAMLSHELRNPLAAVHNALQLLRLQSNDSSLQRQARLIVERQVGQLTHLVDDLLEISRITTGRIRLRLEGLDVRGVVERAVEAVQTAIARRRHELRVSLPERPLWLVVDAGRLEQVLVNLLNNAAKYTDEGGQIELSVTEDRGEVTIRVRDNGIGIARPLLSRIFDPFTQAERSLDRSEGGLGIGLTLAQRVIELHGGKIEAHSEGAGQGSEFVIRLPVPTSQPAHEGTPPPTAQKPSTAWRILVVDDNVDAADSLAMLFTIAGHDARVAYSSEVALELATEYRPDFVLLDIGLPGMDGYEVARRLRQRSELENLRLIALTGYGQDTDRARSVEAGFDHHVVKPVEFESLSSLLASLAARK